MPTYSYDEDLTTNADKVKIRIRQTGTTAATRDFSDEEIAAMLVDCPLTPDRAKVYWVCAELLLSKIDEYSSKGKGLDKRKLSKLEVTYGGRSTKLEILMELERKWRKLAGRYSRGKPRTAKLVNASGVR